MLLVQYPASPVLVYNLQYTYKIDQLRSVNSVQQ